MTNKIYTHIYTKHSHTVKKKGAREKKTQYIKLRKFIMIITKEIVPDRTCQNHFNFLTLLQ